MNTSEKREKKADTKSPKTFSRPKKENPRSKNVKLPFRKNKK